MESLAALRKSTREELSKLAEEHLQHDLQQSDRDTLRSAASKVSTHATIGSLVGIGLGVFMAYRLRTARATMFTAFRATEKPTAVQFANGKTGGSSCSRHSYTPLYLFQRTHVRGPSPMLTLVKQSQFPISHLC